MKTIKTNVFIKNINRILCSDDGICLFILIGFIICLLSIIYVISLSNTYNYPDVTILNSTQEQYLTKLSVDFSQSSLLSQVSDNVLKSTWIYVIPGGGSSNDELSSGYPEWTRQRVNAAFRHYKDINKGHINSIFLALSAGSLNSPNKRNIDTNNIIFECQHIINHLKSLGVDDQLIFGDFISWDSVGNGLTLRLFIEGLLSLQQKYYQENELLNQINNNLKKEELKAIEDLVIAVFISDFHAERIQKTFEWILSLSPSLLDHEESNESYNNSNIINKELTKPKIILQVHSVNSKGIKWKSKADFEMRIKHEKHGVKIIEQNSRNVKTFHEFFGFMLLGPHRGLHAYMHNTYTPSKGAGW